MALFRYLLAAGLMMAACEVLPEPLATSFTYQGNLQVLGAPAEGAFDLEFSLYDVALGGSPVAGPVAMQDINVTGGNFSVELDFGSGPFAGDQLWLGIGVASSGASGGLTELAPRQPVSATPYALHAEMVAAGAISGIEIADGAVGVSQVNTSQIQRRVTGVCTGGAFFQRVNADGTVVCGSQYDESQVIGAVLNQDGAGSGLDADTLDGLQATVLVDSRGDTMTGPLTVSDVVTAQRLVASASGVEFPDGSVQDTAASESPLTGTTCPPGLTVTGVTQAGEVLCGGGLRRQVTSVNTEATNPACCGPGAIATGSDGYPLTAYIADTTGSNKRIAFTNCHTPSCDLFDERNLVLNYNWAAGNVALTRPAGGRPVLAYFASNFDLILLTCNNQECTSTQTSTALAVGTINADAWVSLTFGSDGLPFMLVFTFSGLDAVHCVDLTCQGTPEVTPIVATGRVGLYSSLQIGADGLPVASFYDDNLNALRVLHCGDLACSKDNLITTLDQSVNAGRYNSLAIAANGLPIIAYSDETQADVELARCLTTNCASFALSTVLSSGDLGIGTSLALRANNLPVISTTDRTGTDRIQLINCDDAACTTVTGPYTVSGPATLSGMLVGADGLPFINLADEVVHCGRFDCNNP